MTNAAEAAEAIEPASTQKICGWIYTIEGTRKAHHVYCNFVRDQDGNIVKEAVIPAVSKEQRIAADLVSTCLWHPVQAQLYLYAGCIDIDKKNTLPDLLTKKGRICPARLRGLIRAELPRSEPYMRMVWSTNGQGIHLWWFFPAFALNEERNEKQRAMVYKITRALKRVLQGAGYGADDNARGLHHLYANWRNEDKQIDSDIVFHQTAVRRALDDKHSKYNQILSTIYYELSARPDCRDIFTKPLEKPYRAHAGISRKLMAFIHANYQELQAGETIVMRSSQLIEALGVSKNTLPKLLTEPVGIDRSPTEGIVIEKDLQNPGYYRVSRGRRFDSIRPLASSESSPRLERKGVSTMSVDVIEPLKHPEKVMDGERHYEVIKATLKLKLSGVEVDEAVRIVSIYAQRAIKDSGSITLKRVSYFVENCYRNWPDNKGTIPNLAPNWLLTITSRPFPKSLKGALKSDNCRAAGRPPGPQSDQAGGTGGSPLAGSAEVVDAPLLNFIKTAESSAVKPSVPFSISQPAASDAAVIPITDARRKAAESWTGRMSRILSTATELPRAERDRIFRLAVDSFRDSERVRSLLDSLQADHPAIEWPEP